MKQYQTFLLGSLALCLGAMLHSAPAHGMHAQQMPKGSYFGQTPPGTTAKPFAPGVISKEWWDGEGVFSPDMKEFYYTTSGGEFDKKTLIGFRFIDGKWQKYLEEPRTVGEVTFSHDGTRMYRAIKYKERLTDGWSDYKSVGPEIDKKEFGVMRLSASTKGTYFFDNYFSDAIWVSVLKDGKRQPPKKMAAHIIQGKWTAHPFVAADESYLIWDSEREGGHGGTDIYISFKKKDGTWGAAINMGKHVNSAHKEFYATVTPDGKYILFNRKIDKDNTDIYWVDATIIEKLRQLHGPVKGK